MKMKLAGYLFLVCLFWVFLIKPGSASPSDHYLIVVSLDGFRWDYLNRGITPNLQKIAERGVRAVSLEPVFPSKTFPNHYSIVTGLYPQNHGIIGNYFKNPHSGGVYRLGDTTAVRDDQWYLGEAIWAKAKREGVISACYFWPGSETKLPYRHPDYYKRYDDDATHETRVAGVMEWLALPEDKRPKLIFLYFSDTDTQGHRHGPDSDEVNDAIRKLDSTLGSFTGRLSEQGLIGKTNLIILSDHGMSGVDNDKTVQLSEILNGFEAETEGSGGPLLQIFLKNKSRIAELCSKIRITSGNCQVYPKYDMPEYYHYDAHPWIGDIIVLADQGYRIFSENRLSDKIKKTYSKGDHGYDPRDMEMHGIFLAAGPDFKTNYFTGSLALRRFPLATFLSCFDLFFR